MGRKLTGLAAREARLARTMLIPAFVIVFAVIIFPVIANIWISFKPVMLGDLRAPTPIVRAQLVSQPQSPGDTLSVRFFARNSSRDIAIDAVTLTAPLPAGLTAQNLPDGCSTGEGQLRCDFGTWEAGYTERLNATFTATERFFREDGNAYLLTQTQTRGDAPNVLLNTQFTLENFKQVLEGRRFFDSLANTFVYTFFGTLGSILLGLFAAQLLTRKFAGRGLLRGLFLFPYVAPVIAVAFTWTFFLDPFSGTVNALLQELGIATDSVSFLSVESFTVSLLGADLELPLALTTVVAFEAWRYFPFAFLFILARFQAIPDQLYEVAEVDGAGSFQKFWHVTIPQLMTVLTTLFLLRFMWTFNKFDDVFLLTGGAAGTRTLPIEVYDNAFGRSDIGAGSATSVLLFIFLGIFLVIYFRTTPETDQ
jgi:multiple sugar transport system permease protein